MTEPLTLRPGVHLTRESGMCVMEAVAYIAGEPHSDHPECACPVIGALMRRWNDDLTDDETRTRLLGPMVPRLVGTRSTPDVERRRSMLALDWLVREHTPAWLDLTPALADHAAALRALPEIVDTDTAQQARPVAEAAGDAAFATGDATGDATWDAARDAADLAARAAGWDAARDAAELAARSAGWDAVRAAALAATRAAGEAAWYAARAAGWYAAWYAGWAAGWAAGGAAARDALAPTTAQLQESALRLVERMIAAG